MALAHYGVLAGRLTGHHRDTPDNQGRWFHVHVELEAAGAAYDCAVDVDSHESNVGVQWRLLSLAPAQLGAVTTLADGYHELPRQQTAGALDLIRHPALAPPAGCLFVAKPPAWLEALIDRLVQSRRWMTGSNIEAATALETILQPDRRTLIWGEPFTQGRGMHNVHQNQGDPASSQWWAENAIWQDGAVMTQRPDGALDAFVSKFSSQASKTDADGHPV
jgi:Uncharacterized conserved protein (DUF2278)